VCPLGVKATLCFTLIALCLHQPGQVGMTAASRLKAAAPTGLPRQALDLGAHIHTSSYQLGTNRVQLRHDGRVHIQLARLLERT